MFFCVIGIYIFFCFRFVLSVAATATVFASSVVFTGRLQSYTRLICEREREREKKRKRERARASKRASRYERDLNNRNVC